MACCVLRIRHIFPERSSDFHFSIFVQCQLCSLIPIWPLAQFSLSVRPFQSHSHFATPLVGATFGRHKSRVSAPPSPHARGTPLGCKLSLPLPPTTCLSVFKPAHLASQVFSSKLFFVCLECAQNLIRLWSHVLRAFYIFLKNSKDSRQQFFFVFASPSSLCLCRSLLRFSLALPGFRPKAREFN